VKRFFRNILVISIALISLSIVNNLARGQDIPSSDILGGVGADDIPSEPQAPDVPDGGVGAADIPSDNGDGSGDSGETCTVTYDDDPDDCDIQSTGLCEATDHTIITKSITGCEDITHYQCGFDSLECKSLKTTTHFCCP